jgi:DNA-binding NtrC family response regulator
VIAARGFARKNEDGRNADRRLAKAFLQAIGHAFGRPPAGISRQARQLLVEYHWPGNVRQLRNTLERAAILCEGGLINGEHLSLPSRPASASSGSSFAAPTGTALSDAADGASKTGDLKTMERAAIERALRDTRHNKSKAARLLGLTRTQLYVRLRKYGLD